MEKHIDIIGRMMFAMANYTVDGERIYPTLKAAKDALDKQIPKKAILHGHNPYKLICSVSYTCPNCNKHISITPCCDKCGQALDWSDTE